MKLNLNTTILLNNKKVNILEDDQNNLYYEIEYQNENYNVIKLISDICDETENLTKINAYYVRDNKNYYLTEVENVKTIEKIIQSNIKLSNSNISYLLYQILNGLKTLHNNNILHKNLNLNTITVDKDITVKITNYSLASDLTQYTTSEISNDEFNAPELIKNYKTNLYSDIYSVGVILKKIVNSQDNDSHLIFNHIIEKCTELDYTKRYQNVDEILKLIEHNDIVFFPPQIEQIEKAKKLGLNDEQLKYIATPSLNSKQMGVLKHAFDQKIDIEIIKLMNNPNFSSRQMYQIMQGYLDNLNYNDIKKYTKDYYSPEEMAIYRTGLVNNFKQSEILSRLKTYKHFTSTSNLDDEQQKTIRYAFYNNIKLDLLNSLLNEHLTLEQMREIVEILKSND